MWGAVYIQKTLLQNRTHSIQVWENNLIILPFFSSFKLVHKFSFMENKVLQCIMHYELLLNADDNDFSSSRLYKTIICNANNFDMLNVIFPQRSITYERLKLIPALFAKESCWSTKPPLPKHFRAKIPQFLSLIFLPSQNKTPSLFAAFAESPLDLIFGLKKL